jgi:hypothetical protein
MYMWKYLAVVVLVFIALTQSAVAKEKGNLVTNADYSQISTSGDPTGWYRDSKVGAGVYFALVHCPYIYTENDLIQQFLTSNITIFRPKCPPYASKVLTVSGTGGWYFTDIQIPSNRKLYASFDYQPYTYIAQAVARYTLADGSMKYETLADLPQQIMGGMGYVGWSRIEKEIVAPKNATSMTIFFNVAPGGICGVVCGPGESTLSIANLKVTTQPQPASSRQVAGALKRGMSSSRVP